MSSCVPRASVDNRKHSGMSASGFGQLQDLVAARGVSVAEVTNLLPMASSVASDTEVNSNMVVDHPSFLGIDGRLAILQCNELNETSSTYVVLM